MRILRFSLLTLALLLAFTLHAQYDAVVTRENGQQQYYPTSELQSIDIDPATGAVTITPLSGSGAVVTSGVSRLRFLRNAQVRITEARGWLESAYVKFEKVSGASTYHVYVRGGAHADWTQLDAPLVRDYGTYGRADALGLRPGNDYQLRVVPVGGDGAELAVQAADTAPFSVEAYDRSGFAHKDYTSGVGAYNDDGTLKSDAIVIYATAQTAKIVQATIVTGNKNKTTDFTGLQAIINGYQKGYETRPLCVRLIGTIAKGDCDELLSSTEGMQIKGKNAYSPVNITIEGVGNDAVTTGFGFLIRNCGSVELRNFANMLCMDDAVSLDTSNERIWVHHLDLFYGQTGKDSDQVKGDGTVDIKADSRLVTVAYCHFWDTGKSSLCGMKSETGPNWICYHHNWFDHSDSRHPRIRTMSVHIWNNYYDGVSKYGVGAAYQSNAFVEANYFRGTRNPMLISMQGSDIASGKGTFSSEDGGMIKAFGNVFAERPSNFRYVTYQQHATQFDAYEATTRDEQVPATVKALQGGRTYDNFDTDPQLMYSYTPDAAEDVPAVVTGWTGAGRMGHGDFQWTFNNASDDAGYDLNTALKQALQNYKPTLVGVF